MRRGDMGRHISPESCSFP